MASKNPELGKKVHDRLVALGIETPMLSGNTMEFTHEPIKQGFRAIMLTLGLDLTDDSLKDTPKRVATMFTEEVFYGLDYSNFPAATVVENKMKYDELLVSKGIDVKSMCEHHFVPFIGTCAIGYLPGTHILGLSKFNRIVDFFSRRPQVQERLTAQIHAALTGILGTNDVAVYIEAKHYCVHLRGVQQSNASTVTSELSGRFMENPALRAEFMTSVKG